MNAVVRYGCGQLDVDAFSRIYGIPLVLMSDAFLTKDSSSSSAVQACNYERSDPDALMTKNSPSSSAVLQLRAANSSAIQ